MLEGSKIESVWGLEEVEERLLIPGYYIEQMLAKGGMALVYLARRRQTGIPVAVKILSKELAQNRRFCSRFIREARLMAAMNHPNIVPVVDVGKTIDGRYYIAMHYIEGQTVDEILHRAGSLDEEEVVLVGKQVASALAAAHKKAILHRDVKPGNILIDREGRAYLFDFGLALPLGERPEEGVLFGTPEYMSPEQARGRDLSPKSDVYSLGATLYHMLYGRVLFEADTAEQIAAKQITEKPNFPEGPSPRLIKLLSRMLSKDPSKRPTAEQVAAILEAIHEGRQPPPVSASVLILRLLTRWWWVGAAVAAGIIAVLVI